MRPIDNNYKTWRAQIYKRDRYTCQWPKCNVKRRLNAHHIRRWSDFPGLRFNVNNGITLCSRHHKFITGNEDSYAPLFFKIVAGKQ